MKDRLLNYFKKLLTRAISTVFLRLVSATIGVWE